MAIPFLLLLFSLISPSLSLLFNLTYTSPSSPLLTTTSTSTKFKFKYSIALIVSLPIGTPPQSQPMVLDTASQLSWIHCLNHHTSSFDPSLSSSFSSLPCSHPACKPPIPDFSIPTDCDPNNLCHYSYFYADGTLAQGNLVKETLSNPLILGCSASSDPASLAEGILGMNLGRLSFTSQSKTPKFSYCISNPTGSFYLGENPSSNKFNYIPLLEFKPGQLGPNFDPLAYTVGLVGIKIGSTKLSIPGTLFRPDAGGSGQTILDSGTEFTFLVDEAYDKVKQEIVRLVGARMKRGYVYEGALEMCFTGDVEGVGRVIGGMTLVFDKGVEVVVEDNKVLADVGGGVSCFGIGRSGLMGVAGNIIGSFHQRDMWVEYDLVGRRVGFGRADCSRS